MKSRTGGISIFLNSQLVKETSIFSGGALLSSIEPGTYLLRIEKAGRTPWSKAVVVEPTVVTEIRNILLAPNELNIATSSPEEVLELEKKTETEEFNFSLNSKGELLEKTSTTTIVVTHDVHSFRAFDDTVYFVNKSGFLAQMNRGTRAIDIIGRGGFFMTDGKDFKFLRSPQKDIAILDSSGGLFILDADQQLHPLAGSVKKIAFDNRGERLMLVEDRDIDLVWVRNNNYQPFQKSGTVEHIITVPSDLKEAVWFYRDNAHIILNTREGVYITETDGRGGRNTIELYYGKAEEIRTLPEAPDKIFFRRGERWLTLTI